MNILQIKKPIYFLKLRLLIINKKSNSSLTFSLIRLLMHLNHLKENLLDLILINSKID